MKINIVKTIGKSTLSVDVEGADETEALVHASGITTMPDKCTLCASAEGVELSSNKAQEKFTYVKIRCLNPKCRATSTMGVYQDKSGVYWKEFSIYVKEDNAK